MDAVERLHTGGQRLLQWLTADGRVRVARPRVLAIGPLLLLLALLAPARWLWFIAYVYLLLTALAYAWVRSVGPRVRVERRRTGDWARVGDTLEEEWFVSNTARLPLLWLLIDDHSTLPGSGGRRVAAAGARDYQRQRTTVVCRRRGRYQLGPLQLRLGDPFGLFAYEWPDPRVHEIVVYPPLLQLPPLQLPRGQRGGLARADLLQQQLTPSVGGLREYVPGDMPSHVHWPTVARTGRLMVKQFDQERAGALWIALDLHQAAYAADTLEQPVVAPAVDIYTRPAQSSQLDQPLDQLAPATALELAVALACSLAARALAEGRLVGLLADDGARILVTPGRGPRQLWRILANLVDVQARGNHPLGAVLERERMALGGDLAGAALVVVTPEVGGDWLPAAASWQHGPGGTLALLVAADASASAGLTRRLAAQGIAAETFSMGTPLPLLDPPRPRTQRRVSPLGRVRAI